MTALTWSQVRGGLDRLASSKHEYAGLPLLVHDVPLHMAKGHPFEHLNGMCLTDTGVKHAREEVNDGARLVNRWYSHRLSGEVLIWREKDGSLHHAVLPAGPGERIGSYLQAMGALQTYDLKAEKRAQDKLRSLIKPHLFEGYMLCGMFLETSKRSGVTYIFRRLAPTVAIRCGEGPYQRVLASLCLHPIGFYGATTLGVMVPTDDVIAHLLLMRGCEKRFWKASYQHDINDWRNYL